MGEVDSDTEMTKKGDDVDDKKQEDIDKKLDQVTTQSPTKIVS